MPEVTERIPSMRTVRTFLKQGTCSEALCNVLNRACGHPMEKEEKATMLLAGGIVQHGYQCGQLWGASLAAGAEAHRQFGTGPKAETMALAATRRMTEHFQDRFRSINCLELTKTKWEKPIQIAKYFLKGGMVSCLRMSAKFANIALADIKNTYETDGIDVPAAPVSCAAEVVRKMGGSEEHAIMAAGLAGGIGLSGGACGALGAALWMMELGSERELKGMDSFRSPEIEKKIEDFLEASDYKFECSEIIGRKFDGVADHAEHLRCGGCSGILEALAEASGPR